MSSIHDWADYKLELVDGSLNTVAILDMVYEARFQLALFGEGGGALSVALDDPVAETMRAFAGMYYLKLWYGSTLMRCYMPATDDYGYARDGNVSAEFVEIMLDPLDKILDWRAGLDDTPGGVLTTPNVTIDDGFKWIVDHVIGPNAYDSPGSASRVLTGFTVEADASAHPTSQELTFANKKSIYSFLQRYGPHYDVDWAVWLETTAGAANQFVFRTYYPRRGLDKTSDNGARAPVVLNDASANVVSASRRRNWRFANVIIYKSTADEVEDAASVAAFGRREIIGEDSDADKAAALLEDKKERIAYDLEFEGSPNCEPITHFVPGDLVTVNNLRMDMAEADQTVKMITIEKDASGRVDVGLTLGEYEKDINDDIADAGGGGNDDMWDFPVLGIKGDGGSLVPFSDEDPSTVTIAGTALNISSTETVLDNLLTLDLIDTAVTPATYGDATHVGQFTVDQKGRLTLAADVAITGSHDAVTLDVNAATILELTGQELGLDTQTANYVWAGPVSGVAAVPAFRALVAADIPDISATYAPAAHALLSATHGDTNTATAAKAMLIAGAADGEWYSVAAGGAGGVLRLGGLLNTGLIWSVPSSDVSGGETAILTSASGTLTLQHGVAYDFRASVYYGPTGTTNLLDLDNTTTSLDIPGSIVMDASKTVDGVDVSAHYHTYNEVVDYSGTSKLINTGAADGGDLYTHTHPLLVQSANTSVPA